MPSDLLSAHLALDTYFESLYKTNPLKNDDERLEILLKQYVQMTGSENA
ncbi:type IIL restriction-modification enzyme MmeI [Psychrobacter sp.]